MVEYPHIDGKDVAYGIAQPGPFIAKQKAS